MSAIFGLVRRDGAMVAARDGDRLADALRYRALDGMRREQLGVVTLGHALAHVTHEDAFEAQPLHDAEAGLWLVADARIAGVVFTGSTQVAKAIQRSLAAREGPIVPLIAETGGINAMLVDSTALPEQVVDAVVQSAFRSAGQRCSALRLLLVHEAMADGLIRMLQGAARELVTGDPAQWRTDVGPVIDGEAYGNLQRHIERLHAEARPLLPPSPFAAQTRLLAPQAFRHPDANRILAEKGVLSEEQAGPFAALAKLRGKPGS